MGFIFCKVKSLNPGLDPASFWFSWMKYVSVTVFRGKLEEKQTWGDLKTLWPQDRSGGWTNP
jgi:hypothetical protein